MRIRSLLIGIAALTAFAVPRVSPAAPPCGFPGEAWGTASPTSVALDATKLQSAMDWATLHQSHSVLVIRHGCLAGSTRLDPVTSNVSLDGWSMTKSVTSMLVGRAVTMGALDIDAPIGRYIPEADAAHGRLTSRHLLTMSSGLHHNWFRDPPFAGTVMPDQVRDALSLRFDRTPGTWWEYAQTPVTLLLHALERAVGQDVQSWAQTNLFGPIGIAAGSWTWDRDRAGHTEGWAHLHMRSVDFARLGYLMLRQGNWNGTQLISVSYVRAALSRISINGAYGFLFWLNGANEYVLPNVYGPDGGKGGPFLAAPSDLFAFVGMRNQRIFVIPSLDMVIVRLGEPGELDADTRNSVWQSQTGVIDHELLRRIMQSVTDVHVPDPGPYKIGAPIVPPTDDGLVGDAAQYGDVLAGLGIPPWAPQGCTPLGCT